MTFFYSMKCARFINSIKVSTFSYLILNCFFHGQVHFLSSLNITHSMYLFNCHILIKYAINTVSTQYKTYVVAVCIKFWSNK